MSLCHTCAKDQAAPGFHNITGPYRLVGRVAFTWHDGDHQHWAGYLEKTPSPSQAEHIKRSLADNRIPRSLHNLTILKR